MKKIANTLKTLLLLSLLLIVLPFSGCDGEPITDNNQADKTVETETTDQSEQDFNNSGSAKAIEEESDLWQVYEFGEAGLSLKYPHNVELNRNEDQTVSNLIIDVNKVSELEDGPGGYDKETALKNIEALKNGEYGELVDQPLEESQKVRKVGPTNAQEFMVLSRFDICSVTFQRKLYFFNNDYQIVITLIGPTDKIVADSPDFFTTNEENCGEDKIWDLDKQDQFYTDLASDNGSEAAQEWFNTFESIMDTIEITNNTDIAEETTEAETPSYSNSSLNSLQGKWRSTDDNNSVIEFTNNTRTHYYGEETMNEDPFILVENLVSKTENNNGKYLIVYTEDMDVEFEILELTDSTLSLSYLARGNTLNYERQ